MPVIPPGDVRRTPKSRLTLMEFPDLAPWFDNASDDYHELPAGENETSHDE